MLGNALAGVNVDVQGVDMLTCPRPKKGWWRTRVVEVPYRDEVTHATIYRMLTDGAAMRFPVVFQTIQAMNRKLFQARVLPEFARFYDVIILDRWNLSTRVYGGADGVPDEVTDEVLSDIVQPDITFVFDGNPFPKEGLDVYEANNAFQEKVREGYRSYCEKFPEMYVKIDANRAPEQVHADILRRTLKVLGVDGDASI